MPLTTPEDFVRLGEHLKEIDQLFSNFLQEYRFINNTGALGRYPHRSAVQYGSVNRKIDLQMQSDHQGKRQEEFNSEIRYSLWAGAWLDENETRYSIPGFIIFENIPYHEMKGILKSSLEIAATKLLPINREYLLSRGRINKLPPA